MATRKKELAKFLAGAAAWDALGHLLIHFSGTLPLTFFGITLTRTRNGFVVIVAATIAISLAVYGWRSSNAPLSGGAPFPPNSGSEPAV